MKSDDFIMQYLPKLDIKLHIKNNRVENYERYNNSLLVAIRHYDDGRTEYIFKDNEDYLSSIWEEEK